MLFGNSKNRSSPARILVFLSSLLAGLPEGFCEYPAAAYNPPERLLAERPTMEGHTARPLRYRPDGGDFVIENGAEYFNRPLYGGNTPFRSDAGDKPEISLYLPGHGGNIRMGIRQGKTIRRLDEAERLISRYRPGSMVYEIEDPLLGKGRMKLTAAALYEGEGVILRAEIEQTETPCEWVIVYGGVNGRRGQRGGDIGCEAEPVGRFFQFRPEFCRNNQISIRQNVFVLKSKVGTLEGVLPTGAVLLEADGRQWETLEGMAASAGQEFELPVVMAGVPLQTGKPAYFLLRRIQEGEKLSASLLEPLWEKTEQQRRDIAGRISADTPDPFINAAASALCVAADAIWDEPEGVVMHGAVAWRTPLAGWRGPYVNDALGWHERAERYLTYWAARQNTKTDSEVKMGPDPSANLARSHPAKQSCGDIGGRHYDMNLIYVDTLFRHLMWTGDWQLAEQLWPVLERHFAWERRLFRRPFGQEGLPLYEAYAAIWASDDLQYNGGGVTHSSAYNYFHNQRAAQLAGRLGKDRRIYQEEAELISKAMQKYLWLADRGWYAEWKDYLGLQLVHPSAALWTFYHSIDCGAAEPAAAWQMSRYVDTQIAPIPIHGPQIPIGLYYTLPTTNWMPYTWSTNNVAMAEVAHTALAYWQAGRPQKAFSVFKGCILDSMYMGLCPGNFGMTTYFDMARGEAQRDFGDAVGIFSRTLIEGLFGIRPDALEGNLTICPGFPEEWEWARLRHPDIVFSYQWDGQTESYSIRPRFPYSFRLVLQIPARGAEVGRLAVNGRSASWKPIEESVDIPRIEIAPPQAETYAVEIVWKNSLSAHVKTAPAAAAAGSWQAEIQSAHFQQVYDPQKALDEVQLSSRLIQGKAVGTEGHRTVFAQVQQGQMKWLVPIPFEIRPAFEIVGSPRQREGSLRFRIRNNTSLPFGPVSVRMGEWTRKTSLWIEPNGISEEIILEGKDVPLVPGSNRLSAESADGRSVEGVVVNWKISLNESEKLEAAALQQIFNDKLSRIFQNEYVSPRSPFCSLAIPKQGIGSWCDYTRTFEVNDSGLRRKAQEQGGRLILPGGIGFEISTEADAANIVFTSQWDNYPTEVSIKLSGRARHLYLLMAGSTNSMQSRIDNGEAVVFYKDGSAERLALHNPTTWWPIDQDYFIDDYGFRRPEPIPPRVYLKAGQIGLYDISEFKGKGSQVPGGAATVLDMPLRPDKTLQSLTVRTLTNEVVIGLMGAALVR